LVLLSERCDHKRRSVSVNFVPTVLERGFMDQAMIALLMPIIGLVLVLVWLYFVVCNKHKLKLNISAFGVTIDLSANKGVNDEQDANS